MKRRGSDGFALLDVLVGVLIASVALVSMFGGIALAGRTTRGIGERLAALVRMENEDAQGRRLVFAPARPSQ